MSYDELVDRILADKDAPVMLMLAAFLYKHGESAHLLAMIEEAVALNEKEAA